MAGKTAPWAKVLAAKDDELDPSESTWWKKRIKSQNCPLTSTPVPWHVHTDRQIDRQTDKYNKDVRLSGKGWGLREGVRMEHRVLHVVGT